MSRWARFRKIGGGAEIKAKEVGRDSHIYHVTGKDVRFYSEGNRESLEGSEQGRERTYVKDLSGSCEDLRLWRGQDGSRETSQEATDKHMTGMAGMMTMEVARDGWSPGVLWTWEVRKREESRMTPWVQGGWMVPFSQPGNSGGGAMSGDSRAPF